LAFDRVTPDQLGNRRAAGTLVVNKMSQALTFKEGNAPTVTVVVGQAAALRKPTEAEGDVGWGVGIHAEELAHGSVLGGWGGSAGTGLANAGLVEGCFRHLL
jgi:hypothetical protein